MSSYRHRIELIGVMLLALGVILLVAGPLGAQPEPAASDYPLAGPELPREPAPTGSRSADTGNELVLRDSRPLVLAPESSSFGWGYKLGLIGVIVAGGLWLYKKRKMALTSSGSPIPTIRILSRTSIGVRTELLIVDLDGQKLLLGVTPGSIQRLAVLAEPEIEPELAAPEPGFDRTISEVQRRLESYRTGIVEQPQRPVRPSRPGKSKRPVQDRVRKGKSSSGGQALSLQTLID